MGDLRMNEGCSLRISIPEGYPPEIQMKAREITEIYTLPDKRKQGFATELLKSVCAEADRSDMALLLHVKPYDEEIDSKCLQTWYAKHGFVVFQTRPTLMCRTPAGLKNG